MQKRHILLIAVMTFTLITGLLTSIPTAQAITVVTPTPGAGDDIQPSADEIDVDALLEEAIEKLDAEDYDGAIDDLNAIIRMDEALWDAYFFRAFAYSQIGDENRAIDDYTRALNIKPYDWTTYTLRAELYLLTEDLAQANIDYDQAIYYNPRYAQAYAGKALLNLQRGDQTLGQLYQAILEAQQSNQVGDVEGSIDLLSDAIENTDAVPVPSELGYVYYNRANNHISLGNWDEALSDMNQAIELQPEMQDYYMARGFVYSETDQMDLAAPDFYQRMTLLETTSIDGTIDFGESVPVEMAHGTIARLTFDGEAGQNVTITARDSLSVGVDPLLILLDVDGNPIVGNDDGGGEFDSLINDFELPETGTYTVMVSHANAGFDGTVMVSLK